MQCPINWLAIKNISNRRRRRKRISFLEYELLTLAEGSTYCENRNCLNTKSAEQMELVNGSVFKSYVKFIDELSEQLFMVMFTIYLNTNVSVALENKQFFHSSYNIQNDNSASLLSIEMNITLNQKKKP